jgi:hypothetical protein
MELLIFVGAIVAIFWGIKIMAKIGFSILKLVGVIILLSLFGWNIGIIAFLVWVLLKLFGRA